MAEEYPVGSHRFHGALAGKAVEVSLSRVGDRVQGRYCYGKCGGDAAGLALTGAFDGAQWQIEERPEQGGDQASGRWQVRFDRAQLKGEWVSADGARRYPLDLRGEASSFPFDLALQTEGEYMPGTRESCGTPPRVTAIKVYRAGKLVQTLPTDSQGTCDLFLPQVVDYNFDGHADLSIAQTLPAGPNIPHEYWLFDPATQRFVANEALSDITSPEVDVKHKRLYHFWRASCCSHGLDVYAWKGKQLVRERGAESYWKRTQKKGQPALYCYVLPIYDPATGAITWSEAEAGDCQRERPVGVTVR